MLKHIQSLLICALLTLLWDGSAAIAAPDLSLSSTNGIPESTIDIVVGYVSDNTVVGLQFDVNYDAALVTPGSVTKVATMEHTVYSDVVTPGKLRLLVTPPAISPIPSVPTANQLINIQFTIASGIAAGTLISVTASDTVMGDTDAQAVTPTDITNGSITVAQSIHIVTPSPGNGGTLNPNSPQTVAHNATQAFTVTPNPGYVRNNTVGGDCPQGSWNDNIWTTGAITADCTVNFSFTCWACLPNSSSGWRAAIFAGVAAKSRNRDVNTSVMYEITPWATSGGNISPDMPVLAPAGTENQFTVTAQANYIAAVSGSCGGTLIDNVFTTKPLSADCDVAASFSLNSANPPPASLSLVGEGDDRPSLQRSRVEMPTSRNLAPTVPEFSVLNDTGIFHCADATHSGLPCPVADFPRQDAEFGDNNFSFTKLDNAGNEVADSTADYACVRDNATGLVWEIKPQDGILQDRQLSYSWYVATRRNIADVIAKINQLDPPLCGSSDWRLPTAQELAGLVDYDIAAPGPTINTDYFSNVGPWTFWAARNPAMLDDEQVLVVDFTTGSVSHAASDSAYAIRLVHNSQPAAHLTVNGNQTVSDANTHLMWAQCPAGQTGDSCEFGTAATMSWAQALSAATESRLGGYDNWRLPNSKELQSILDHTTPDRVSSYFPNTPAEQFWSASPNAGVGDAAWTVNFADGVVVYVPKSGQYPARWVRNTP